MFRICQVMINVRILYLPPSLEHKRLTANTGQNHRKCAILGVS